ncbi:MAG TPA: putative metallopeptidase [Thermodesulfobacteriota bacterium]|nr:putative metallopeptidase [Thermodesulfobacteriota bacterium]
MIRYELAPDIESQLKRIARRLKMDHIDLSRVKGVRSYGSSSVGVIARCHALPKVMQLALEFPAHYVIEILNEAYSRLPKEEQVKILIHELMHIPETFGGGFRMHKDHVTRRNVEKLYKKYIGE